MKHSEELELAYRALEVAAYPIMTGSALDLAMDNMRNVIAKCESPALTPAQEHAEELLKVARWAATIAADTQDQALLRESAQELVARIDPPAPPSAEELARALDDVMNNGYNNVEVLNLLHRARSAGLLKEAR